jgi:tetratricopeptide (TPR) repeat protein
MASLLELLEASSHARSAEDWRKLEEISIEVLRLVYKESKIDEGNLRLVVQNYLSSIVGTGEFLTNLQSNDSSEYQEGLAKLLKFLENRQHQFASVQSTLQAAHEIALLSLDPISANRNKISKHLREIARPDLSIVICKQILEQTRLNYYSLTVLCGAYCDLNLFDKAIEVAELALKFSPESGKTYPLNALVRAHTLKFKATGDFAEIEQALSYGHMSIDLRLDSYAANAFIAAAIASSDEREIEFAKDVLAKAEPQLRKADIAALFQTYQAAQALAPKAEVVETIDESTDDTYFGGFNSLFDLVSQDEGFTPEVLNVRNMQERFGAEGWFLQGLSNVPCPTCELVALHSYRKHFKRYGKDMHYWALVCDNCKTATDSIDYDKKAFTFISSDLEENFPVADLCTTCLKV